LHSIYAHLLPLSPRHYFFFFNDPAPTEIYTLSLHDALPISGMPQRQDKARLREQAFNKPCMNEVKRHFINQNISGLIRRILSNRSEEHTSELQSRENLVCRLLLEKKKKTKTNKTETETKHIL